MKPENFSKELADAVDGRAAEYAQIAVRAGGDVRARIRRRRGATLTVAAVATLAVAGGAWWGASAFTGDTRADPAATWVGPELVTVTPGRQLPSLATDVPGLECGAPAPAPVLRSGDFEVEPNAAAFDNVIIVDPDQGRADATRATTTYLGNQPQVPAYIARGSVWVQDGAIVGYEPDPDVRIHTFWAGGAGYPESFSSVNSVLSCDAGDPLGELPSGRYDVYPVVRVVNSLELAAYTAADRAGYSLQVDPDTRLGSDGKDKCADPEHRWLPWCAPASDPELYWNEATGTATVRVTSENYSGDVDELFVLPPFTWDYTNLHDYPEVVSRPDGSIEYVVTWSDETGQHISIALSPDA